MNLQFIVALTEHRTLGYLLVPYLIKEQYGGTYFSVVKLVREHNLNDGDYEYNAIERKIVQTAEKYSDDHIAKHFRHKGGIKEMLHKITTEQFTNAVVPYIEKNLVKNIELIRNNEIKLYQKAAKYRNLYDEDQIQVERRETEAIFRFERLDHETRYSLILKAGDYKLPIQSPKLVLLTNSPCSIFYGHKLYFFPDLNGAKMKPFLQKRYISVQASVEKKYFETFVLSTLKTQQVEASGFEINNTSLPIQTELVLSKNGEIGQMKLRFRYGKEVLSADHKEQKIVQFSDRKGKFTFQCSQIDQEKEQEQLRFIESLNCELVDGFVEPKHTEKNNFFSLVNWLNEHHDAIEQQNISVVQEDMTVQYFVKKQDLSIEFDNDEDWFDIRAIVSFGDFKIPFIRFKKHIINGIREYELPDGTIAILPESWFEKYRDILTLGEFDDESLKVKKHHFQVVEDSVAGIQKNYLERFEGFKKETNVAAPETVKAELRNYQLEGYQWMMQLKENGFGGCLADDMGLGKTLQTLALLDKVKRTEAPVELLTQKEEKQLQETDPERLRIPLNHQPASIIVLPTSLVHNWASEIEKFTPHLNYVMYTGQKRRAKYNLTRMIHHYDVILTTYGTVRNDEKLLSEYRFHYAILDEGQNIKNPTSKTYKAVSAINSNFRLVLTGTPIENSLSDLWAQINYLNDGLLGKLSWFKKEFITPIERKADEEQQRKLNRLISPFILRRKKEDVAKDLPAVSVNVRVTAMEPKQKELYEKEKSAIRNSILSNIDEQGLENSTFAVLQGLTKMRQLANHPQLVEEGAGESSGKFNEVMRMMRILRTENHKILIFSSFVKHLEIFESAFKDEKWKYSKLTGQTSDRQKVIEEFQNDEENKFFLISLKAGGVGLNLTQADYVFILDPWWNPAAELQAINRAHRIGQKKNVFVYRFISEETIEEKIQKLKQRKTALAEKFINSNNPFQAISKEEMLSLFD